MRLIDRLDFGFARHIPLYLQTQAAECGLMCVAMVAAYHGEEPDLAHLRRRFRASIKGTSFEQLLQVAAALRLSGRALRTEPEGLKHLPLPCILHWNMGHFVVLSRIRGNKATILDPAHGKRIFTLKALSENFTGAVLELTPTQEFGGPPPQKRGELKLWSLAGKVIGLKSNLFKLFLIGLGIEALTLLSPLFIQWVTDHALVTGDKELLFALALGFGFLLIVRTVLEGVRGWAVAVMSAMFNLQWMGNIFTHLVRLPIMYYERRHLGDILSRFNVIQTVQSTLTVSFVEAIVDGFMVIGTLVMMWIYSPVLAGVAIVAAAIYVVTRLAMYRLLREASYERIVHEAKQQSLFMETVRGIVSIRMANREEVRISHWLNHVVHMKNSGLRQQRYQLIFRTTNSLVFGLSRVLVITLGAMAVLDKQFSIGMLLAFMAYKDQFSTRATGLIDRLFELRLLELQGMRLADIVFMQPEQDPSTRQLPPLALEAHLELRGLRLRYGEREPMILDSCSLTILPGQLVVLFGIPGSGKTTLLKAVLGLFPNSFGEILLGGVEIKKLGLHNYRNMVAGVFQDERPFAGTVAESLCFFSQTPDEELIEQCARWVNLHDEINALPMRYQTIIGDLGTALSASQRQKLLLARALYRQPKILVLDDATSHFDIATEIAVFNKLRELGIGVITVTRRQEVVALADRMVALHMGKLIEQLPTKPATAP